MSEPIKIMEGENFYGLLYPNKKRKYAYLHFVGSFHVGFCDVFKQELRNSYRQYRLSKDIEPEIDFIGSNEFWLKILKEDFEEVLPSLKEIIFEFSHWQDEALRSTVELGGD